MIARTNHLNPPHRLTPAHRRAFTLIEVMTVVAILAILGTLTVLGLTHVLRSAKVNSTKTSLQNAQALYDEYNASIRPSFGSGFMLAPGSVSEDLPAAVSFRDGSAVRMTAAFVNQLRGMPNNRSAMDKLSPSILLKVIFPQPGGSAPPAWANNTAYKIYDRITFGTTNYFSLRQHLSSDGTVPNVANNQPPSKSYWVAEPSQIVTVLLDAWNNPILLVPGGQLSGVTLNGVANQFTPTAATGRPFWVSAGPDGDFSKGDDNIYSFEK